MDLHRILVVDDSPLIRKTLEERLRNKRYAVATAETLEEAERRLATGVYDLVFLDVQLPDGDGRELLERISERVPRPIVVMITANTAIEAVVECMRAGAFDYITKPFSISQIDIALKKAADFQKRAKITDFLNRDRANTREMIGNSPAMKALRDIIHRVARTNATVMISGENGSGKELVANEIFLNSNRADKPYIKVNCAVISEKLMESEFFGHEKGAFTGATEQRDGRFELADGGTILLDEISEIPIQLQAKLLRVLQEREFERVGGNKTIKVDVRVIATTNRNLIKAVENGDFREDLYYRLHVFPIHVPPLRERVEDIPLLAQHFFERSCRQNGVKLAGFAPGVIEALCQHRWPGNVRELQNVIERAVILAEPGKLITLEHLGIPRPGPVVEIASQPQQTSVKENLPETPVFSSVSTSVTATKEEVAGSSGGLSNFDLVQPLHLLEKAAILRALEVTGGNRTKAAELLQVSIRTLRNKLAEYRAEGTLIDGD
ncbi:MAG: sigma-54 dependent transcriptional regulator [Chthoniobacterales bacterium]|nr:sigma-54 dependent transcriptional regulator [Chthoniobacterales bacterium]